MRYTDISQNDGAIHRITLVHNPSDTEKKRPNPNSFSCKLLRLHAASAFNQTHPEGLLAVLDPGNVAWSSDDAQTILVEQSPTLRAAFSANDDEAAQSSCITALESNRLLARELGIAPGQQMLVVNGRVSLCRPVHSELWLNQLCRSSGQLMKANLLLRTLPLLQNMKCLRELVLCCEHIPMSPVTSPRV